MSKYEARQDFCWSVALDTWEGGDVVKEAVLYTLCPNSVPRSQRIPMRISSSTCLGRMAQ